MPISSAAQYGYDPYRDTGSFLSSAWKSVKKVAKKATKLPGISAITAPVNLVSDVARGRNVLGSVKRAGGSIYSDAKRSMPLARTVVSFVPGVGTAIGAGLAAADAAMHGKSIAEIARAAATGAIPGGPIAAAAVNAMAAGLSGANIASIAEAAARGAVPQNIMTAVDVARDAARGKNIANAVLSKAAQSFVPGSQAAAGFNIARAALTGGNVSAALLAQARQKLGSEEARRAFDSAVGTVSREAGKTVLNTATKFAPKPVARVLPGPGRIAAAFRPLAPKSAAALVRRTPWVTLSALSGRRETAGLDASGSTYTVEKGDSAWAIAQKLTKNGNNWRQLVQANPQKKTNPKDGNFATLFAGEVLKLPTTWQQAAAPKLTADVLSQARAILKVWSESDGLNQAGVTNYGDNPADSALIWGPRDKLMMMAFVSWFNDKFGQSLPLSSDLTDKAADALRAWLAKHANSTTPAPSQPQTPSPSANDNEPASTSPGWPAASSASSVPVGGGTATNAQNPLSGTRSVPDDITALVVAARNIDDEASLMQVVSQLRAKGFQAEADKVLADFKARVVAAGAPGVPADVQAMAAAAQSSGSVDTMRKTANAIYAKYSPNVPTSVQALVDTLNTSADKLEAAKMGVPDPTVMPEMVVTGTAPKKSGDDVGPLLIAAVVLAKLGGLF